MTVRAIRNLVKPLIFGAFWFVMNQVRSYSVQSCGVHWKAKVGKHVIIREGVECLSGVSIADYSYISGPGSYIESGSIGKFCSIARQVVIGVGNHDHQLVTTHPFISVPEFGGFVSRAVSAKQKPGPVIGNDVWIGINSVILRGVVIGDGAVIAANSVVTRDVLPYTVVGGSPARFLKNRFSDDIRDRIVESQWWNWDRATLTSNLDSFRSVTEFIRSQR